MNRFASILLLAVLCLATAAHAQTVEVIPNATQPTAAPTVKVDGGWTPANVVMVVTIIIGAIASTLIPSIIALLKATRAEEKTESNSRRLDRQGDVQTQQLIREGTGTGNGTPPPGN